MTMEYGDTGNPQDNSVETEVEEEVVADGSTEEEAVDWEAKFKEMEARATKAENDKKAIQGAKGKQADQDALLLDIYSRLDSQEKSNAALIKALASQDMDNLGQELDGIQSKSNQDRATARFQNQYKSVYDGILEDAQDDEGNILVDVEKDPRLESFRNEVISGYQKGSIADIVNALPKFHKLVRQIERENAKAAIEAAREEARESSKSKLRKAGLGDHDLGSAAAGGSDSSTMTARQMIMAGLEKSKKNK
jgi:hypothetical protein